MSILSPPPATLKLARPAVIELRFTAKDKYTRTIDFYRQALGVTEPVPGSTDSLYSFPVGMVPAGKKEKDIELRFVLLPKSAGPKGADRIIVYWEVQGSGTQQASDNLKEAYKALKDKGYSDIELPHRTRKSSTLYGEEEAGLLKDSDGNYTGLVVNPLYPRFMKSDSLATDTTTTVPPVEPVQPGSPDSAFSATTGLALLAGLVLGVVGTRLFRSSRA